MCNNNLSSAHELTLTQVGTVLTYSQSELSFWSPSLPLVDFVEHYVTLRLLLHITMDKSKDANTFIEHRMYFCMLKLN